MSNDLIFVEIGARLRTHRLAHNFSPDVLADRLGISRAALYRAEKGQIRKIEMLEAISRELGASLPSLLGVGVEYIPKATSFFKRLTELEVDCEKIIGLFSPVSYLLTTEAFDRILHEVILECELHSNDDKSAAIAHADEVTTLLKERKDQFYRCRPLLVSLIQTRELEQLLMRGMAGHNELPQSLIDERLRAARAEVKHLRTLLGDQRIGIQIGLVTEPGPGTSFQLIRKTQRSVLAINPFRLGNQPNIRLGVASLTAGEEVVDLHEGIVARCWESALKGAEAVAWIDRLLEKHDR